MISLLSALLLSHMKNAEMIVSDCVETLREEREFMEMLEFKPMRRTMRRMRGTNWNHILATGHAFMAGLRQHARAKNNEASVHNPNSTMFTAIERN